MKRLVSSASGVLHSLMVQPTPDNRGSPQALLALPKTQGAVERALLETLFFPMRRGVCRRIGEECHFVSGTE